MSELAMAVSLGRASGWGTVTGFADLVGHLYVGGSGAWLFSPIPFPRQSQERPTPPPLRLRSHARLASEIKAGAVLAAMDPQLFEAGRRILRRHGASLPPGEEILDPPSEVIDEIGALVGDAEIGCLVTSTDQSWQLLLHDPLPRSWQVLLAGPQRAERGGQVGDLFAREPYQWGLRGDPYAWAAMRERLADVPMPPERHELQALLHHTLREVVGAEAGGPDTEPTYVEEFAHGGISSGMVDLQTWRERLIPILIDRSGL